MIRNSKGFTLIELMIVVVIIGILAAIAIPKFSLVALRTKQAEAGPVLKQLCTLAEAQMYKNDNNAWPADQDELEGWQAPSESFFTFTLAGSTAYATTTTAGLVNQEMNCTTKAISNS